MMSKILHNALICYYDNQLHLADIYFTDQINEIRIISKNPIVWKDVNTKEKHQEFLKTYPTIKKPSNVLWYEANGSLVIPGAIDSHVHFNTPGFEFREDFEQGSVAAACGGVTTIIDMTCTSDPPVTNASNLKYKLKQLKDRSLIDYALWGGVSGNHFKENRSPGPEIRELAETGVVGFKTYLVSGMSEFPALNLDQMFNTAGIIQKTGLPLAVHAEDYDLVARRQEKLQQENKIDWRAFCESRDVLAETTAVAQMREVATSRQCRVHIVHLSSQRGVEIVREAKKIQIPLTAETCPHYFMFSQDDFDQIIRVVTLKRKRHLLISGKYMVAYREWNIVCPL